MRVLFLIDSLASGGTEWQLTYILPELVQRGMNVDLGVLFPVPTGSSRHEIVDALHAAGVRVHPFELDRRWNLAAGATRTVRLLRRARPDILHARLYFSGLVAAATRVRYRRLRRIVSFHGLSYDYETSLKSQGRKVLEMVAMHTAVDAFAAVSRRAAESYACHLRLPHVEVIPNAVPTERLASIARIRRRPVHRRYGLGRDEPYILIPARQVHEKGHRYLVDALARMPAGATTPRVLMVGRGPEAEATRRRITSAGLDDRIILHASDIPHDDVLHLMAGATLVVLPSTHEGFPNAAAEAMAVGTPLLGTAVGGLLDLVESGQSGLLVPSRDPEALTAALRRLLTDPSLRDRLGRTGQARVRASFSVESVADRWTALYEATLRRARPATRAETALTKRRTDVGPRRSSVPSDRTRKPPSPKETRGSAREAAGSPQTSRSAGRPEPRGPGDPR